MVARMTTSARLALVTAASVALGLVSVVGVGLLAAWPPVADVTTAVILEVRPRSGVWRLLRGSLRYVAVPALLLLAVAAFSVVWRRDRLRAAAFGASFLVSNLLVQLVKHGQLPSTEGLNPLSGHAGLACGLALSWYAVLGDGRADRGSRSRRGAVLTLAAGTGAAVILTGWHSLPQVLGPLGLATGCALVARAVVGTRSSGPAGPRASLLAASVTARAAVAAPVVTTVVVAVGVAAVGVLPRLPAHPLAAALACVTAVLSATVGAMRLIDGVGARVRPLGPPL